ncbi:hypothetical protein DRP07_11905 [Archaeoglobales archaeon]|nr:MAG: hypothetical protein DRP07_11905 [Archaeoglobales archaeon]
MIIITWIISVAATITVIVLVVRDDTKKTKIIKKLLQNERLMRKLESDLQIYRRELQEYQRKLEEAARETAKTRPEFAEGVRRLGLI